MASTYVNDLRLNEMATGDAMEHGVQQPIQI